MSLIPMLGRTEVDPQQSVDIVQKILDWMWLAATGLAALVWGDARRRFSRLEADMRDDKERNRQLFDKLFTRLESHAQEDHEFHVNLLQQAREMQTSFLKEMSSMHIEFVKALSDKADKRTGK